MNKQRLKAIEFARSMLGVKWRHQGRTEWAVDCVGLIALSLKAAGLNVDDTNKYSREPWNDGLQKQLKERFGEPVDNWQTGDIAVFQPLGKEPCHVGFLVKTDDGFNLIHSRSNAHVMEHRLDKKWQRMLVEVYSPWVS